MEAKAGIQSRGDDCSKTMFAACLETIRAREGAFGAPRVLEHDGLHQVVVTELGPVRLLLNSDGVGTKIEIAERLGDFGTIAFDLVAMLVDDAVRFGARPLSMSNVLDCRVADAQVVEQLAAGLVKAAGEAEIAVVGGEVAELGDRVGGWGARGGVNWAGTLLSLLEPDSSITGTKIEAGQAIVALREEGFRSNGFTLARKILQQALGCAWHKSASPAGLSWGLELLRPSRIYAPLVVDLLFGGTESPPVELTGVVHVTGGGVPGKLGRLLGPRGLGAELDGLFDPSPGMLELQRMGGVADALAYGTWCMGQGMLLMTPDPERVLELAVLHGYEARVAGHLVNGSGLRLRSRGALQTAHNLTFAEDDQ